MNYKNELKNKLGLKLRSCL